MTLINYATIITGALGLSFMLISLIGLIRLPDFYTRLHAQGIGDTLGALLMIISMMLATSSGLMSLKLLLVFMIIVLTSPLGTNLMMIAGMNNKEYREYKRKKNTAVNKTKADNKSVPVKKTSGSAKSEQEAKTAKKAAKSEPKAIKETRTSGKTGKKSSKKADEKPEKKSDKKPAKTTAKKPAKKTEKK